MRFSFVLLAAAFSALPLASPALAKDPSACTINARAGYATSGRWLPSQGIVKVSLPFGTPVEIVTVANDRKGCPWALVRQPGELYTNYGWTDRRMITCR